MSVSLIWHCYQAPCFWHLLSELRGSCFSTWLVFQVVQAATSIGRTEVESL